MVKRRADTNRRKIESENEGDEVGECGEKIVNKEQSETSATVKDGENIKRFKMEYDNSQLTAMEYLSSYLKY